MNIENLQMVRNYYAYRNNPRLYESERSTSGSNYVSKIWLKTCDRLKNIKNALLILNDRQINHIARGVGQVLLCLGRVAQLCGIGQVWGRHLNREIHGVPIQHLHEPL
jgi:hypothetical protein